MTAEADAVMVDAELERQGISHLPNAGSKWLVAWPTLAASFCKVSGDTAVFGGEVHVGVIYNGVVVMVPLRLLAWEST